MGSEVAYGGEAFHGFATDQASIRNPRQSYEDENPKPRCRHVDSGAVYMRTSPGNRVKPPSKAYDEYVALRTEGFLV